MKSILVLLMLTISNLSFAVDNIQQKDLGKWINKEILIVQESFEYEQSNQDNYVMQLSTIRFRIRPSFGLEIPFIAKAKIKPEVELYWSK